MRPFKKKRLVGAPDRSAGFLSRLRRDTRGNVLALVALWLLPLAAFSGSAIDMGRIYAVKLRLQQACDSGVLAGRKSMVGTTLDTSATGQAQTFFKNNFRYDSTLNKGWFSTTNVTFTPQLSSDIQVNGTASATVPMTLMAIFGQTSKTITVTCQARYDVADADLMFVLDTTGSMACLTSDSQSTCDSYATSNVVKNSDGSYSVTEKSGSTAAAKSRIQNLREAVATFYTTLTGPADPSTHFRFGFVPYSATVNVGSLLPRSYMATSNWTYQTRWQLPDVTNGSATSVTTTNTQAQCSALAGYSPYTTNPGNWNSSTAAGYTRTLTTFVSWTKTGSPSSGSPPGTCITSVQPYRAVFRYGPKQLDVTAYAGGSIVTNPSALDGDTSTWNGCIEERATTASASFSASSAPPDLDVDSAPTSDETTKWRPMWPDAEYARSVSGATATEDSSAYRTSLARFQYGTGFGTYEIAHVLNEVPCPRSAQRLRTMSLSDVNTYLQASNGFRPYGVTYHDVGMTWGTRLLSPNGMFASDTSTWPGHNAPNRYIIFLTDGLMEPDAYAYTSHGMEQWDQRVTGGSTSNLNAYHSSRFATACQIAKNHNITIFLIAYASSITSLSSQMQGCASPGQTYIATDSVALNAAFGQIAKQVALLRISK